MRRFALSVGFVCAAFVARGDQLILMPTARRLPPGALRGELWGNRELRAGSLSAGLGQVWDAQFSVDRFGRAAGRATAAVAYYYLTPIADLTPGISAGILDAANATVDGRRLYACATLNRSLPGLSRYGYAEFSVGLEAGRRPGPMAGFRMPIARSVSLLGEFDGFRFNAGVEGRTPSGAYARLAARAGVFYAVVGFRG